MDYFDITDYSVDYNVTINNDACYQMNFLLKSQKVVDGENEGEGIIVITFTLGESEDSVLRYEIAGMYHDVTKLYSESEDLYIKMLPIKQYDSIDDVTDRSYSKLNMYLRENLFYQIPEVDVKY